MQLLDLVPRGSRKGGDAPRGHQGRRWARLAEHEEGARAQALTDGAADGTVDGESGGSSSEIWSGAGRDTGSAALRGGCRKAQGQPPASQSCGGDRLAAQERKGNVWRHLSEFRPLLVGSLPL